MRCDADVASAANIAARHRRPAAPLAQRTARRSPSAETSATRCASSYAVRRAAPRRCVAPRAVARRHRVADIGARRRVGHRPGASANWVRQLARASVVVDLGSGSALPPRRAHRWAAAGCRDRATCSPKTAVARAAAATRAPRRTVDASARSTSPSPTRAPTFISNCAPQVVREAPRASADGRPHRRHRRRDPHARAQPERLQTGGARRASRRRTSASEDRARRPRPSGRVEPAASAPYIAVVLGSGAEPRPRVAPSRGRARRRARAGRRRRRATRRRRGVSYFHSPSKCCRRAAEREDRRARRRPPAAAARRTRQRRRGRGGAELVPRMWRSSSRSVVVLPRAPDRRRARRSTATPSGSPSPRARLFFFRQRRASCELVAVPALALPRRGLLELEP